MPFEWDSGNLDHIAGHRLTADEVEQAVRDPGHLLRAVGYIGGEWRAYYLGRAHGRRLLLIVVTRRGRSIRVVTAFPVRSGRYRQIYEQQEG